MIDLVPCPRCASPVALCVRAQGKNTHFARCTGCGARGKELTTSAAAAASWNEDALRKAAIEQARAIRARRRLPTTLAKDPAFVEAVLSRFLRIGKIAGNGDKTYHVMRVVIDGVEREGNVRAFVDTFVAHQWPEILDLVDPETVVHRVLRDAGHPVFAMTGKTKGPNLEAFERAPYHVGDAVVATVEPDRYETYMAAQ